MKTDMIFKSHPHLDEYFTTSDGQAFFSENAATVHAKTLKNKAVKCVIKSAEMEKPETPAKEPKIVPIEKETDAERDQLIERYVELFGKKPNHNSKNETIEAAIAKKEAELAAEAENAGTESEAENADHSDESEETEESDSEENENEDITENTEESDETED